MTAALPPDTPALRQELCRVAGSLFERGYAHATAGNLSVRVQGGFLITPTDACLGRLEAMAAWGPSTGEALHTSTFLGHPLASAAALATLAVLADEQVPARAAHDGIRWSAELQRALAAHPAVTQIRGKGLMWGLELQGPHASPGGALTWQVVLGCLRRGVIVLPCGPLGDVLQLTPPVCMSETQRAFVVATLVEAIDEAWTTANRGVMP